MKITVFSADPGNHRFIQPIIDRWQASGITVEFLNNYQPTDADI